MRIAFDRNVLALRSAGDKIAVFIRTRVRTYVYTFVYLCINLWLFSYVTNVLLLSVFGLRISTNQSHFIES